MAFDTAQTATSKPALRGYRCCECKAVTHLSDLNDAMKCRACGEPDEDPEDVIDTSTAAMLREHSTWGL